MVSSPRSSRTRPRWGLNLVELLVVVAIITLLLALTLPAVQRVRESASRAQCQNNLKQLALAMHHYHTAHGFLPYTRSGTRRDHHTWCVLVLPFVEQVPLYENFSDIRLVGNDEGKMHFGICALDTMYSEPTGVGKVAIQTQLPIMYCPSRRSPKTLNVKYDYFVEGEPYRTNYEGSCGDYAVCIGHVRPGTPEFMDGEGAFVIFSGGYNYGGKRGGHKFEAFRDGQSNVLLLGEKHVNVTRFGADVYDNSIWNADDIQNVSRAAGVKNLLVTDPQGEYDYSVWPFGSMHRSVVNFAFADGSVHGLKASINGQVLECLSQIADGKPVPALD